MAKALKRRYYPHDKWEEFPAGMWRNVSGDKAQSYINAAGDLMRSPEEFKLAMLKAIEEWPISCEVNLTAQGMNRQAWLGHAACCIAVNSPENCTRLGWHTLSQPEQDEANRVADEAIALWEGKYREAIAPKTFDWD